MEDVFGVEGVLVLVGILLVEEVEKEEFDELEAKRADEETPKSDKDEAA